jgi:hypothetical protein
VLRPGVGVRHDNTILVPLATMLELALLPVSSTPPAAIDENSTEFCLLLGIFMVVVLVEDGLLPLRPSVSFVNDSFH